MKARLIQKSLRALVPAALAISLAACGSNLEISQEAAETADLEAAREHEAEMLRLAIERERLALARTELEADSIQAGIDAAAAQGQAAPEVVETAPVAEAPAPEAPVVEAPAEVVQTIPVQQPAPQPPIITPVQPVAVAPQGGVAGGLDTFYQPLSPHGQWFHTQEFGYIWQPGVAVTTAGWQPYWDGRWAYTNVGWTWISNEPFGWATYHYGRWTRIVNIGWCWVPGYQWGPAWVSWRHSPGYVGWAPLPAETLFSNRFRSGVSFDLYYGIGRGSYLFLSTGNLYRPARGYCLSPSQSITVFNQTTNITNIRIEQNNYYFGGPRYDEVNRSAGGRIPRYEVSREGRWSGERGGPRHRMEDGGRLAVYAPEISRDRLAEGRPDRVARNIERPVIARDGVRPDPELVRDFARERARNAQRYEGRRTAAQSEREVDLRPARPVAPGRGEGSRDTAAGGARVRPDAGMDNEARLERGRPTGGRDTALIPGTRDPRVPSVTPPSDLRGERGGQRGERVETPRTGRGVDGPATGAPQVAPPVRFEDRAGETARIRDEGRQDRDAAGRAVADARREAEARERAETEARQREVGARQERESADRPQRENAPRQEVARGQAESQQREEGESRQREAREQIQREEVARQQQDNTREQVESQQREMRERSAREESARRQQDSAREQLEAARQQRDAQERGQREAMARQQQEAARQQQAAREQASRQQREVQEKSQREAMARQQQEVARQQQEAVRQQQAAREQASRQQREVQEKSQREAMARQQQESARRQQESARQQQAVRQQQENSRRQQDAARQQQAAREQASRQQRDAQERSRRDAAARQQQENSRRLQDAARQQQAARDQASRQQQESARRQQDMSRRQNEARGPATRQSREREERSDREDGRRGRR